MAKPADIENGQKPDATKLMAWLNWLAAGKGIASGASAQATSGALPAIPR